MKQPKDTIEMWLDILGEEVRSDNPKLSKEDRSFIESVTDSFDRRAFLTDAQIDRVKAIFDRVVD